MKALRALMANPGFTLPAIAVLAIGIGVNSAMLSVVDAVLLRPMPWKDAGRLVLLQEFRRGQTETINASSANYLDWRERNHVFESMAAIRFVYLNLADDRADPDRVQALRVTPEFLPMIGVRPAIGRMFRPEEFEKGADRVVLLANGFWRRRYAADPSIAGKQVTIEGEPYHIAGVLPEFPMFRVLNRELDLYAPLAMPPQSLSREDHSLTAYARLRDGVSAAQAQSEMQAIAGRIETGYPTTNTGWSVKVTPLTEAVATRMRTEMQLLMSASIFVLLIACANIASLMLAWSAGRRRELAIRMALGATRGRIVRQLAGQSLAIAVAGGVVGAVLAQIAAVALDHALSDMMLRRMTAFRVNDVVLAFTAGISLASCLLFGLWPAIRSSRFEAQEALAGAASRSATGRGRAGRILIVCEAALATVLLIATAAVARSAMRMVWMDRGIDVNRILTMQMWMDTTRYPSAAAERQFAERVLERVRAIPGVEAASAVSYPPLGMLGTVVPIEVTGRPAASREQAESTRFRVVDTAFFRTLRLPLLAGREFTSLDSDEAHGVVIVSETFAHRYFPGESALGRRIRPRFPGGGAFWYPTSANVPLEIVGIARDVREDGIDVGPLPQIYLPFSQNPSRIMHLLVRTSGDPSSWTASVRAAVRDIDPYEPLFDVKPYEDIPRETFARQRAFSALLGGAAALALLLAASGIYAQMAWSVSERTREIGIRVAVGATPRDVVRWTLREALAPAAAGVAAGIVGAVLLSGSLAKLVAGMEGADLYALTSGPAVLLAVAVASTIVPMRRALRVDPVETLRE